jgi:hypothetical protein
MEMLSMLASLSVRECLTAQNITPLDIQMNRDEDEIQKCALCTIEQFLLLVNLCTPFFLDLKKTCSLLI